MNSREHWTTPLLLFSAPPHNHPSAGLTVNEDICSGWTHGVAPGHTLCCTLCWKLWCTVFLCTVYWTLWCTVYVWTTECLTECDSTVHNHLVKTPNSHCLSLLTQRLVNCGQNVNMKNVFLNYDTIRDGGFFWNLTQSYMFFVEPLSFGSIWPPLFHSAHGGKLGWVETWRRGG